MAPSAAFLQLTAFPKACVSIHVFLHSECSTSQGALGVICSYNLKGPTKHTILMLPPQTHEASLSKLTSWLPALAELSSIESHMWWGGGGTFLTQLCAIWAEMGSFSFLGSPPRHPTYCVPDAGSMALTKT